jgi:hypothetical protein
MARAPKSANASRAAHLPWDKEGALPIPAGTRRARRSGAAAPRAADAPRPATRRSGPQAREEYPGPQTASTGEHVEPGNVRPFRRRTH